MQGSPENALADGMLEAAAHRPTMVFAGLRELSHKDPRTFFAAAMPLIGSPASTPGRHYVISLLMSRGLAPPCDPAVASLDDEITVARALGPQDPQLDRKLARRLLDCLRAKPRDETRAERILSIAAAVSEPARIAPLLSQLLTDPNPRLRSKAVLLHARASRDPRVVEALLDEPNPRVRANAIEALWGIDSPEARAVLQRAARDSHNRVAGNALLGLVTLNDTQAAARVRELAESEDARLRATAAWVMGASVAHGFLEDLARMIRDPDTRVRHSVFRAIVRLRPLLH
ncbi:MAG TPA: HEAT repeat domain-containing protein [Bryobacteraceae bacterium]|nr:HEAT repeat domain-containing protein [Bryobacteraceae bacterium]